MEKIAILGTGLLGGSLGLALADQACVRLWARRSETVAEAQQRGLAASADLQWCVADADCVVLCVPVGAMAELARQAVAAGLPAGCVVTDVGSVKRRPHAEVGSLLRGLGYRFIGSHPMAGSEKGGVEMARADLFRGAACLLTNDDAVEAAACQQLERLWQGLGCRTRWMSASQHDDLVARLSHFPHILAAVAAQVALNDPNTMGFGGGGLRDTTRVAGGNPTMWAEILMENRDSLIEPLRAAAAQIDEMLAILTSADHQALQHWLQEAKLKRDALSLVQNVKSLE